MCRLSRNLGASTSWNPKGLSRPVMGLPYFYITSITFVHRLSHFIHPVLIIVIEVKYTTGRKRMHKESGRTKETFS
jgi:hypothetical protein